MSDKVIDSESIKRWIIDIISESNVMTDNADPSRINQPVNDDSDVTFKKLENNYDLKQAELRPIVSGKSILQKFRKILQLEIRDWSLLPILEKQTFFNLNLISIFSSIVKKQNSMNTNLDEIQSKQHSMNTNLDEIQSKQHSMNTNLDEIQSKQHSMNTNLDEIQSKQHSMNTNLDEIQSKQHSMNTNLDEIQSKQHSMNADLESVDIKLLDKEKKYHTVLTELSNNLLSIRNSVYNTNIDPKNLNYESLVEQTSESFDVVLNQQSSYLQYIKKSNDSIPSGLFIDIGSGRGEFLELLFKLDISCQGIENNPRMLESCLSHGHTNVQRADGLDFLRESENDSFKGITLFHVIEHFNLESMIHLIHQSLRTLKKNGVLILETVNPDSLFSLMSFWKDPTHMHPIPSDMLKFYLEMAGFVNVKVIFNSPVPDQERLEGSDKNTTKLNNILFGPRDYAVIGWK